jgi:UPF0755 protein
MKKQLVISSLFILVVAAFLLTRLGPSAAPDFPTNTTLSGAAEVVIDIPAGSAGSAIAKLLFDNGVVKSSEAFFRVAVGDKRSEKIAPGNHRLTKEISAQQALEQLLDPERIPNLVRVYEGNWKSEIAKALVKYGFSPSEVSSGLAKAELPEGFREIEGLLFPAQYSFPEGTSALEAVQAMVDRFTQEPAVKELLLGTQRFNPSELLKIASIIQAEGEKKDFAKVSRVIYNRLSIGMPLQMDSTVHFVQKLRGQIFLSSRSTLINSPYNTYKKYGLPPGPICSPGADAITAALEPAAGDWLYFITVAPGDTRFTKSIDEFNSWKAIYVKNRKAGVFG